MSVKSFPMRPQHNSTMQTNSRYNFVVGNLTVMFLRSVFKPRRQLLLENLALRQQVTMLRQSVKRPRATVADKLFWILFSRYVDGWRKVLHGLHPDTVVRWHRQGFRFYWRWKSRGPKPGRPAIDGCLRELIRDTQNPSRVLQLLPYLQNTFIIEQRSA